MKIIIIIICVCLFVSIASAGNNFLFFGMGNSGGAVVGACDGTIDLSTGCVQPMLGGL